MGKNQKSAANQSKWGVHGHQAGFSALHQPPAGSRQGRSLRLQGLGYFITLILMGVFYKKRAKYEIFYSLSDRKYDTIFQRIKAPVKMSTSLQVPVGTNGKLLKCQSSSDTQINTSLSLDC